MSRMKWRWFYRLRAIVGATNIAVARVEFALVAVAVVGIVLLGGAAPAHGQSTPALQDQVAAPRAAIPAGPIVAVRVVAEDGRVLSDCPRGVTAEIGKPLSRADLAASLKALYRTGDYSYLTAVVAEVPGGIRLDFVAR